MSHTHEIREHAFNVNFKLSIIIGSEAGEAIHLVASTHLSCLPMCPKKHKSKIIYHYQVQYVCVCVQFLF